MTNASHIAFITPELDGVHQRRAEYPQQVNAGYGALDSLRLTDGRDWTGSCRSNGRGAITPVRWMWTADWGFAGATRWRIG